MSEITVMAQIEKLFETLKEDEIKRVLVWAQSRYIGEVPLVEPVIDKDHADSSKKVTKKKVPKKGKKKIILKQIKDLNLVPKGKVSGMDFAEDKKPTNVKQKGVVAVYYLKEELGLSQISVDHVFTFFKVVGWPVPADLSNTLQQAGTEGWLDTSDSQNLQITAMGENLVEHQLPSTS